MDNNEKKPKRPRIGEMRPSGENQERPRFERPAFNNRNEGDGDTDVAQRPYQQRS